MGSCPQNLQTVFSIWTSTFAKCWLSTFSITSESLRCVLEVIGSISSNLLGSLLRNRKFYKLLPLLPSPQPNQILITCRNRPLICDRHSAFTFRSNWLFHPFSPDPKETKLMLPWMSLMRDYMLDNPRQIWKPPTEYTRTWFDVLWLILKC